MLTLNKSNYCPPECEVTPVGLEVNILSNINSVNTEGFTVVDDSEEWS